uniref:Uncharacterized protein n=1 Tax=Magallana gigas TaxID=29159 RepID=A0A8W8P019_MAGGI
MGHIAHLRNKRHHLYNDDNIDDQTIANCVVTDSITESQSSHDLEEDSCLQDNMTRKNVAAVYFTEELENEIQERALQHIFISKTRTREDVMKGIHCLRKKELYEHKEEDCSPLCKSKGCSNLRVIDSCWKVCMCHCMFAVPMEIDGYPLLTFPNVCTQEPKAGSVFCGEHHQLLERHQIPTKKEDFLKFLGCAVHPKSASDIKKVDENLLEFASQLYESFIYYMKKFNWEGTGVVSFELPRNK